MELSNLRQWEVEANKIPPSNLRRAVKLALWLIAEKDKALNYAVKTAAHKHNATQAAVLRQVKAIIPPKFFTVRSRDSARQLAASWSEEQHNQRRHHRNMEHDNRRHMTTITGGTHEQETT